MPILTPQDFVSKWKRVTSDEKKKRTLTNYYNALPPGSILPTSGSMRLFLLRMAGSLILSDEEILEKLLALNLERCKSKQG